MVLSKRDTTSAKLLVLNRGIILTIVVVAIVLWGTAISLWLQVDLDKWFLISLNGLRTNDIVTSLAQATSRYGMPFIVLVYLAYLLFAFKYENLRDAYPVFAMVLLMFGLAGIGGDFLKEIIDRPRPFVEYAGEINALSTAKTPALPSGHATKSVALALPFLLLVAARDNWHKGVKILLAVIAFSVCCSRVLLGAHYVSDILAGMGTALICFPLVTMLINKILGNMKMKTLDNAIKIWGVTLLVLLFYLILI